MFIYGVKGNWSSTSDSILVKPVYKKDSNEQWKKIVDIRGQLGENFSWVNPREFIYISSQGISDDLLNQSSVWGKMARAFLQIGIDRENIGYFGSYRLGFENVKDIDFILYGVSTHFIMKNNITTFKDITKMYNITQEHVLYQATTHGKFYSLPREQLMKSLTNKWSSCMMKQGVCSTIRFVDPIDETGPLLRSVFAIRKEKDNIQGIVRNAWQSSFFPRRFVLETLEKSYDVIIPLWLYHQCVKDGDFINITGIIQDNQIIVRDYIHGIEFI